MQLQSSSEIIDNDDNISIDSISFMLFFQSRRLFHNLSKIISQFQTRNENSDYFVLILNF